ncbi:MAG TPA: toll/interleukin-1 receptor domain-containing protein [Chloroflexia bacterium]|nr:toll/interleukin-1 receptor domain-containing protein [Chloroflexia bacterium]
MANPEHLKILKQGVEVWNKWREEIPIEPVLSDADLSHANLIGANLSRADLGRADLSWAKLSGANLSKAYLGLANLREVDLVGADLSGADFAIANLTDANLSRADLGRADLGWANFIRTNLQGTHLHKAHMWSTVFVGVDLSEAIGLDQVQHAWPSSIGIDTIYRSKGKISEVFLRGAGVPEVLIEYIPSLLQQPLQFYSCFISYSSKNEAFVRRLHADLQDKGVRTWFAPEDLKIGDKFPQRIDDAIRLHDKLLIVLTRQSIASSWVAREVSAAREREAKEKRTILFPIRLDNAVMNSEKDWAIVLRDSRHIGDFRGWKEHDKYQEAFNRLLRDLKASEEK